MLNQEIREKIIQNSISLKKYGINDLAWSKETAKHLINSILEDGIGVLGGDVYQVKGNSLEPLRDNWSCEPNEKESEKDCYYRSKLESLRYIEQYPVNLGEQIIFAIVFTEEI